MDPQLAKALDEAAAAVSQYKIPVYLTGPMPSGSIWCATCVVLYVGHFSGDPAFHKFIKKRQETDAAEGMDASFIELQQSEKTPQLQPAITVGPSVFADVPMPVCWTHAKPYTIPTKEQRKQIAEDQRGMPPQPRLIEGKASWYGQGGQLA